MCRLVGTNDPAVISLHSLVCRACTCLRAFPSVYPTKRSGESWSVHTSAFLSVVSAHLAEADMALFSTRSQGASPIGYVREAVLQNNAGRSDDEREKLDAAIQFLPSHADPNRTLKARGLPVHQVTILT